MHNMYIYIRYINFIYNYFFSIYLPLLTNKIISYKTRLELLAAIRDV